MLLLTAFIWGTAFVAQSVGMDYIGPFTFNGVRFTIGGIVLLPLVFLRRRSAAQKVYDFHHSEKTPSLWLAGLCCGFALFLGSTFQQTSMLYTSVGKAGFITALYIVLVPIFGIFFGKKAAKRIWIGVGAAVVGLYLLCVTDSITNLNFGDCLLFLAAISFAAHILVIDRFSPYHDGVQLSCLQFFFSGAFSLVAMFPFETPHIADILAAWMPLLYTGAISCGVAYTLQIVAQKNTDPTVASLLMSMESVFAVLAGWVLLHQTLSGREIIGCCLMFFAIILANLPDKDAERRKS